MEVEFIRFKAADDVELQGWFSNQEGDIAALHIHGMCGNGYQNLFLDHLREMYVKNGISFFSIDTRGFGVINDFRQKGGWKQGGSCFEIFEESIHDIRGAVDYLKSIGKTNLILQGHSLGCSKVVNYLLEERPDNAEKAILLAPTDMVAWANVDPDHQVNLKKAKRLISEGNGDELVGAQCWPLDKTPLSAHAYLSKSDVGSAVDIYGEREAGSLIGKVSIPMLIVYGDEDIGITNSFGNIEAYKTRLDGLKNENTQLSVLTDAPHSFRGYENELSHVIEDFIT